MTLIYKYNLDLIDLLPPLLFRVQKQQWCVGNKISVHFLLLSCSKVSLKRSVLIVFVTHTERTSRKNAKHLSIRRFHRSSLSSLSDTRPKIEHKACANNDTKTHCQYGRLLRAQQIVVDSPTASLIEQSRGPHDFPQTPAITAALRVHRALSSGRIMSGVSTTLTQYSTVLLPPVRRNAQDGECSAGTQISGFPHADSVSAPLLDLLSYRSSVSPTITITKTLFSAGLVTSTRGEAPTSGRLIDLTSGLPASSQSLQGTRTLLVKPSSHASSFCTVVLSKPSTHSQSTASWLFLLAHVDTELGRNHN